MSDTTNDRSAKWATIDAMRERLMAVALPEQLGAVERQCIIEEQAAGLFAPSLASLPPAREDVARAVMIEIQTFNAAIEDFYDRPDRFRELYALKARFSSVVLFERGSRACLVLLLATPPAQTEILQHPIPPAGGTWN